MINDTTNAQAQNCYVPCSPPWQGYGFPYVGNVPPGITIQTADTTQPGPLSYEPSDDDMAETGDEDDVSPNLAELTLPDLEAMIRRVIKEEVETVVRDVLSDRDEADRRERWQDEW